MTPPPGDTKFTNSAPESAIIAAVNSTETPGGSGIPAGWYDDPSGQGLRWWDGERWTEHVHSAESAAAATGVGGSGSSPAREGKPPRDLVKLRESIRGRGVKGVGIVLGAIVVVIVVVALLLSGGGESNGGGTVPGAGNPGAGQAGGANAAKQAEIKAINQQLKDKSLPKAERKSLEAEKKQLQGGKGSGQGKGSKKAKGGAKKQSPGEEGG